MSIFSEREAIKSELAHIKNEKDELRKMYREMSIMLYNREVELLSRLRELDDRDIELSGGSGIYDVQGLLSDLSNTIVHLKELVPQVPVKVLLEEVKKQAIEGSSPSILQEKGLMDNSKFKQEVLDSIARENRVHKVDAVKRDERDARGAKLKFSGKKAAPIVREYLKEQGKPIALKTLINILDAYGFDKSINSTERLKSIMKVDPRIKVASRGYYQYV